MIGDSTEIERICVEQDTRKRTENGNSTGWGRRRESQRLTLTKAQHFHG